MLSTQLIIPNKLLYSPTDAAPQSLKKLTPSLFILLLPLLVLILQQNPTVDASKLGFRGQTTLELELNL